MALVSKVGSCGRYPFRYFIPVITSIQVPRFRVRKPNSQGFGHFGNGWQLLAGYYYYRLAH